MSRTKTTMVEIQVQIVYVLTNPAMPGLVKIGKTTQLEVEERMKQLYSTGVPVPFDCVFACKVKNATTVEKALHLAFGMTRINPNREFFKLEPERVIAVLQLLKVDDITLQFERTIESDLPSADKQSAQALKRSMRPPMNFHELSIPNGSILVSKDGAQQCTVVGEKKVEFDGMVSSLTAATRKLLGLAEDYPLQPSPHWTFNGQTIKEIYEAFHRSQAEN
ncbi:MAG: GIY-YIG nuclease family protein [Rugosibacter sp.]